MSTPRKPLPQLGDVIDVPEPYAVVVCPKGRTQTVSGGRFVICCEGRHKVSKVPEPPKAAQSDG